MDKSDKIPNVCFLILFLGAGLLIASSIMSDESFTVNPTELSLAFVGILLIATSIFVAVWETRTKNKKTVK